jgi:hypothetical protein
MKTRPIIMSADSVRAILDDRKTQTRRVVKRLLGIGSVTEFKRSTTGGEYDWSFRDKRMLWNDLRHHELLDHCPYGVPGDRLWVRETWRPVMEAWRSYVEYKADGGVMDVDGRELFTDLKRVALRFPGARKSVNSEAWHSSLHMPRWASRLTLELTDVKVERVQSISEGDAVAEGVNWDGLADKTGLTTGAPTEAFAALWSSINAKRGYPWEANPWTWALTFKRVTP